MELVLSDEPKLKIVIAGVAHEVRRPSLGEQSRYQREWQEMTNAGKPDLDLTITYLVQLGLPREVVEGLSVNSYRKIVEFLQKIDEPAKKN